VVARHIERKIRVSRKLSGLGGTPGKSSSIPARGGFPQIASVCCSDRLPPAHAALTDGCEKETPREDTWRHAIRQEWKTRPSERCKSKSAGGTAIAPSIIRRAPPSDRSLTTQSRTLEPPLRRIFAPMSVRLRWAFLPSIKRPVPMSRHRVRRDRKNWVYEPVMANKKTPLKEAGWELVWLERGLNKSVQVLTSNAHWSAGVPVRKRTVAENDPRSRGCGAIEHWGFAGRKLPEARP